jgi:acyl-coenzyme A synthetase/AMP-(fatty) acid ligase
MDWWMFGALAIGTIVILVVKLTGARMADQQIADADLDLVREADRAWWRRLKQRAYQADKKQDDFYRTAAYRKALAGGAPEPEARARVRKEFPFYYLNPADRDTAEYHGDDGNLPVILRERVNRNARVIKPLMESEGERFRTMNALIRACVRKGAF